MAERFIPVPFLAGSVPPTAQPMGCAAICDEPSEKNTHKLDAEEDAHADYADSAVPAGGTFSLICPAYRMVGGHHAFPLTGVRYKNFLLRFMARRSAHASLPSAID
jgi:hypothetical protein